MSMNRSILFIFILYLLAGHCNAQELRATVKVLSPEVQATNKDIFQTLETSMENFLNGYAFTDHKYSDEERIECNYIMTVNSLSGNRFDATLQVQYSRPVYNSNYNSPVLKVLDKDVVFSYQENEPIDFQQNTYTTNLSSILSFYAYTIIGLDRCTFKEVPNQKRPNSYLLNLFFDAKNTEILSLYSEAATLGVDTKTLQTTLEGLDRTHASSYGDLGGK